MICMKMFAEIVMENKYSVHKILTWLKKRQFLFLLVKNIITLSQVSRKFFVRNKCGMIFFEIWLLKLSSSYWFDFFRDKKQVKDYLFIYTRKHFFIFIRRLEITMTNFKPRFFIKQMRSDKLGAYCWKPITSY